MTNTLHSVPGARPGPHLLRVHEPMSRRIAQTSASMPFIIESLSTYVLAVPLPRPIADSNHHQRGRSWPMSQNNQAAPKSSREQPLVAPGTTSRRRSARADNCAGTSTAHKSEVAARHALPGCGPAATSTSLCHRRQGRPLPTHRHILRRHRRGRDLRQLSQRCPGRWTGPLAGQSAPRASFRRSDRGIVSATS